MSDQRFGSTNIDVDNNQNPNDVESNEIRSKTYYGDHKSTILSTLDSDRREEDSYCDVILQVDGKRFPAHRCILGKLSPFFNKMFKTEMKEKYDSVANIQTVSGEVMGLILQFIYTAVVSINEDNVMEILVACDYMQFNEVKRFCVEFLGESMDKANCLSMQVRGDMFNCPTLVDTAQTMASQNFEDVIHQQEFKELDKKTALSFLLSRDQKAFGSKAVYEGAIIWVEYDLESRRDDFPDFFKIVKLHLLPASYLEEVVANQELIKESHDCKDHFQKELFYRLKLPSSVCQSPYRSTSSLSEPQAHSSQETPDDMESKSHCEEASDNDSVRLEVMSNHTVHSPAPSRGYARSSSSSSLQSFNEERASPTHPAQFLQNSPHDQLHPTWHSPANDVVFSKELVKILRHGKYKDIAMDPAGFASVQHILVHPKFKKVCGSWDMQDVRRVVSGGDKKRFELKLTGAVWKIRAIRGHTISIQAHASFPADDQPGYSGGASLPGRSWDMAPKVKGAGNTTVSKELGRILRHGRYRDIPIDSAGYASVYDVLDNQKFQNVCGKLSIQSLTDIVESAPKKYFQMKIVDSELKIKALHGHSIRVEDLELIPLNLFDLDYMYVYHQTTLQAWETIRNTGLSRMKRTHIHLTSVDLTKHRPTKPGSEVAIEIHLETAVEGGLDFYQSSDNVVLCEGDESGKIHPRFFNKVFQMNPYKELELPDMPRSARRIRRRRKW